MLQQVRRFTKQVSLIPVVAALCLTMALPVSAEIFMSTQITSNAVGDFEPRINNNGEMVWYAWDGNDYEIWYSAHGVTKQLTNNSYDDMNPSINNHGVIAWSGKVNNYWQIFVYDNTETTYQVTNSNFDNGHTQMSGSNPNRYYGPVLSDGQLVWSGGPAGNKEIYQTWLNQTGPFNPNFWQVTNNNLNDDFPTMHEWGSYAWCQFDGSDWEVWENVMTPSQNTMRQVTNNNYNDVITLDATTQLPIWNGLGITGDGNLAWSGYHNNNWEVFFYNFASQSTTNVTNHTISYPNLGVRINDNNDIVWAAGPPPAQGGAEIYLWQNNTITKITNNSVPDVNPQLNTESDVLEIVWKRLGSANASELWAWVNGTTIQVTSNTLEEGLFRLSCHSGYVVYEAGTAGSPSTNEIFRADPLYETFVSMTLVSGATYQEVALIGPEFGYYIASLNGTTAMISFYQVEDKGELYDFNNDDWLDWETYKFYAVIGQTIYFGVGYDNDHFSYMLGYQASNPSTPWFVNLAIKTGEVQNGAVFDYYYAFANGHMYHGTAYGSLPNGYFSGSLFGDPRIYQGVYQINVPGQDIHCSFGAFWSMGHGLSILEELY